MNISRELNQNKLNFISSIFIILIPIFFLTGSLIINIAIILFDLFFLYTLIKNRELNYLNNKYFFVLLIFWFYLIFNLFFISINFDESLPRSLGFIRFIIFAFAISYFFEKKSNHIIKQILGFWTLVFLFISFDLIFEFVFGFNVFGYKSEFAGRLASVLNEELKIGHFYSAFILLALITIQNKIKDNNNNQNIFFFSIIFFLIISLLIGERSNLIRTFIMILFFIFLIERKNFFKKIFTIFIFLILMTTISFNNPSFHDRIWAKLLKPLFKNPIELVSSSKYGSHYNVAIQVFENNKLFGVGLKNYRQEVTKKEYDRDASIHPHQTHFEILSELGLVGYICFLLMFLYIIFHSFKSFLKDKNKLKLCGLLFVIVSLLPILPSGSFFTTFGAALFWFNFSFLLLKKKKF